MTNAFSSPRYFTRWRRISREDAEKHVGISGIPRKVPPWSRGRNGTFSYRRNGAVKGWTIALSKLARFAEPRASIVNSQRALGSSVRTIYLRFTRSFPVDRSRAHARNLDRSHNALRRQGSPSRGGPIPKRGSGDSLIEDVTAYYY